MDEYRYTCSPHARALQEDLAEIKVAEAPKVLPDLGGLDRIAAGQTALGGMHGRHDAAAAGVPVDLKKHELKKKLESLLKEKQLKAHAAQHKVAAFVLDAAGLQNPTTPDVTPSTMTSGAGGRDADSDQRDRDRRASAQGPAANFIAAELKRAREQAKTAASRLDKEVAKGTVSYADSIPGGGHANLPVDQQRALARINAHAPSTVTPEQLQRTRNLRGALARNHLALGERQRAADFYADTHQAATFPFHGHDPGHAMYDYEKDAIGVGTKGPQHKIYSSIQHEVGERIDALRPDRLNYSHATHEGVTPILMENHAVAGDPEHIQEYRAMRTGTRPEDHDNKLVARWTKEVGHHPDSPLPLGGKHQRALERRLSAQSYLLSPETLAKNRKLQNRFNWVDPIEPGQPFKQVKTLGERVRRSVIRKLATSRLNKTLRSLI